MRVCVLGSGSSGNATYIGTDRTSILVDLGFGWRSLKRRMEQAALHGIRIDAILLTHGHMDHVTGVPSFLSRFSAPVFMNEGTREEGPQLKSIDSWECFQTGSRFRIGDIEVEAFAVSHDAAEPVGFRFSAQGLEGAVATDLGQLTDGVRQRLAGCDWLVVESNHDEAMLKIGPYPWHLKERVLSHVGHLSNQELSRFFSHSFDGKASHVFLAHLSRQNNDPQIALSSASSALSRQLRPCACEVHLTEQSNPSIVLNL